MHVMIFKMNLALQVLAIFGCLSYCWSACTYPSDLIGEWYSTSFGTLNFVTNQSFTGFTSSLSSAPLTFTCFESSGSQYVSTSSYNLVANIDVDVYLCMNLQQISSIKYYFTLDSNLDSGSGIRFYTSTTTGGTVSLSQACSRSDTRTAGEYELLIKKDELSNAVTSCPADLQSTFNVTMTTSSATECEGSQMEGSTGALVFNYSSCATGQLNNGGYLQCLYSKTDGYSYATLYNNDTNTDESSTFLFSCLTFEKDAETLRASESPKSCHVSQTPTSVNSTGVLYVMTDLLYTPPDNMDYTVIIIVVCVIVGMIIIVVIVLVVLYIKVWRKPAPVQPPKIRKRKKQLSITEYTPRSLGRASSVEKLDKEGIKRVSTEEIISGIDSEKPDTIIVVENGKVHVTTKKEAWQKKWESDQSRTSPRLTQETLKRMRQSFPSDSGISRFDELSDLDKAYTLSTSLPESIDIPFKDSPRVPKQTDKMEEPLRMSVTPRYTEKSHASPNIPASTGKFGGSPRIRSIESIPMPGNESKLDTIKENPLSRENTLLSQKGRTSSHKKLKEHPNLTRVMNGGDVTVLSTVLTSHSTASGWQYKWEAIMRPKKDTSTLQQHTQRSQTPVNLFQNIVMEEPSCMSREKKVKFELSKSKSDQYRLDEYLSERQKETNSIDNLYVIENSENSSSIDLRDMKNTEIKTSTTDVSNKAILTIENENKYKSEASLRVTPLKSLKRAYTNKSKVAPINDTETVKHKIDISNNQPISSANNDVIVMLNDNNDDADNTEEDQVQRDDISNIADNDVISVAMTDYSNDSSDLYSGITNIGSVRTLEHIEYDTISLHTDLFFPEDWLYDNDATLDHIWKKGTKWISSKSKREYKQYIDVDEEVAKKKEISPFKKMMKTEI